MADPYAYLVLWVLHRYLVAERSMWEDFRDPEFDGERITYISVPQGRRYEIVARPVAESSQWAGPGRADPSGPGGAVTPPGPNIGGEIRVGHD